MGFDFIHSPIDCLLKTVSQFESCHISDNFVGLALLLVEHVFSGKPVLIDKFSFIYRFVGKIDELSCPKTEIYPAVSHYLEGCYTFSALCVVERDDCRKTEIRVYRKVKSRRLSGSEDDAICVRLLEQSAVLDDIHHARKESCRFLAEHIVEPFLD